MKYLNSKILALALVMLAVTGISVSAKTKELGSQKWQLIELDGRSVQRSKAFIEFDEDQGRFTGNTGCNRMFGSITIIGRRIDISRVATTKMLCTDRLASRTENALVKALEEANRYRLAGNTLELSDRNRVVVRFTAARGGGGQDNIGLDDRKWMLESIKGKLIGKAARGAFLVFDSKKMSAGGDSSCNAFGGSYTVTGKRLAITDIASTMRACVEDERMNIERSFLDGLRNTNRFEIEKQRLMLYRGNQLLLTLRGEAK